MRRRTIICLCLGALLVLVAYGWYFVVGGPKRMIARAPTPEGGELCVTQVWGGEGYETRVYYRTPGLPWGWTWYDHQDRYWGAARVETYPAHPFIVVFRDDRPAITFDYNTRIYSVLRPDDHLFMGFLSAGPHGWDTSEP